MNVEILKMVAPVGLAVAVVVTAIAAIAGAPVWLAAVVGLALAAAAMAALPRRADNQVLRGLSVEPLDEARAPRLHSLLDGLCDTYGYRRPDVVMIDDPAINAVAFGRRAEHATVAVTRGLVDGLDRMQLEGVLARELAAVNSPTRPLATAAVAAAPFVPKSYVRARLAHVHDDSSAVRFDIDGARLTRYPPGLASALSRVGAVGAAVGNANPAARHLWMVDPVAPDRGDWNVATRIDALGEL